MSGINSGNFEFDSSWYFEMWWDQPAHLGVTEYHGWYKDGEKWVPSGVPITPEVAKVLGFDRVPLDAKGEPFRLKRIMFFHEFHVELEGYLPDEFYTKGEEMSAEDIEMRRESPQAGPMKKILDMDWWYRICDALPELEHLRERLPAKLARDRLTEKAYGVLNEQKLDGYEFHNARSEICHQVFQRRSFIAKEIRRTGKRVVGLANLFEYGFSGENFVQLALEQGRKFNEAGILDISDFYQRQEDLLHRACMRACRRAGLSLSAFRDRQEAALLAAGFDLGKIDVKLVPRRHYRYEQSISTPLGDGRYAKARFLYYSLSKLG